MNKKRTLTTSAVAKLCAHSRETVKRWIQQGKLKAHRVGERGHWRILHEDLIEFFKAHKVPLPLDHEIEKHARLEPQTGTEENQRRFCWELIHGDRESSADLLPTECKDCPVYKSRALNCWALREALGETGFGHHTPCRECAYYQTWNPASRSDV